MLNGLISVVSKALSSMAGIWVMLLATLIVADVAFRLAGIPLQGTKEIVSNSVIAIVFLQLPLAISGNLMLRATVLFDTLPTAAARIINIFGFALGVALFASITLGSWDDMITAWNIKEFEGIESFPIPIYPIRTILVAMGILCAICYLLLIVREVLVLCGVHQQPNSKAMTL